MVGLICGDAAGASLEFFNKDITEDIALNAMKMPGGGRLNVGPGQVTDDSELAMSLAYGLKGYNPKYGFPLNNIANSYKEWFNSRPFDIGMTTFKAFCIEPMNGMKLIEIAKENYRSEANGALMRIAPIAIWCKK